MVGLKYDVTAITIFSNEFTYITFPLFPMAAYTFSQSTKDTHKTYF